jgi:hypothetical protein
MAPMAQAAPAGRCHRRTPVDSQSGSPSRRTATVRSSRRHRAGPSLRLRHRRTFGLAVLDVWSPCGQIDVFDTATFARVGKFSSGGNVPMVVSIPKGPFPSRSEGEQLSQTGLNQRPWNGERPGRVARLLVESC